jgi:hypothetical protein
MDVARFDRWYGLALGAAMLGSPVVRDHWDALWWALDDAYTPPMTPRERIRQAVLELIASSSPKPRKS